MIYSKLKSLIRNKLRAWLGITNASMEASGAMAVALSVQDRLAKLSTVGANVRFRGNTQIVVISRIQGGAVQIYDLQINDARELADRMHHIVGPAWPDGVIDAPHGFEQSMRRFYK